jgi:ABC-2 type transport system permease protein
MRWMRIRAIFKKELRHIARDPRSLALALVQPLIMLLLFGSALSLDVDRIATLVYDADQTSASRELIRQFQGSRYFQVKGAVDSARAVERGIDRDRILIGLIVPRDYAKHVNAGQSAVFQILLDGSDSNTASIALGYVNALVQNYSTHLRTAAQNIHAGRSLPIPIDFQVRMWYNSSLESKNFVVPGLVAVILVLIAGMLASLTIAREWEMGTMEQLLSTPVRPAELVLAKMLGFFTVGAVDTVIAVLVGIYVFDVPFRGNIFLLALTSCMFLCGVFFWGILVSALARTQLVAYQVGVATTFLPSFLLSGFVYSIDGMPKVVQAITHIVPARYFVTILRGIFLKGVGFSVLWPQILFLAAFMTVVFLLATWRLSQKLT